MPAQLPPSRVGWVSVGHQTRLPRGRSAYSAVRRIARCIYGIFALARSLTGELLYFGDRQFYRDWWNATTVRLLQPEHQPAPLTPHAAAASCPAWQARLT